MAANTLEHEWEVLPELEAAHESAHEGEGESEQFFGALSGLAQRGAGWLTAAGSPQRRFALWAAREALRRGLPAVGRWAGQGLGGAWGAGQGGTVGGQAASWLSQMLPQQESGESEWESEVNPVRKWYADAMLEHLGHAAAEAEHEAEAEALAGAMIPLVAASVPRAAAAMMQATPGLVCGVSGVVNALRRGPGTKPLVRVIPSIVRRTAASIAQQAASGTPVTPQTAVRTLARHTAQVLGTK